MAVAYQQIEDNKLSKTEVLSSTTTSLEDNFNLISSVDKVETVAWPVQNALELMITVSDNYSALLLAQKIKLSNVSSFLSKSGLLESKIGTGNNNPVTTAHDTNLFLEKLYRGEFAENENTESMLNILKNQNINTKLSLNIPKDVVIAHKTGELDGISHDAGIVYSQKGDYIIVVLSKTKDPLLANQKIAELSKKVYDYFSKS